MAKSDKIRNCGLIPERRHDAFLLALLLAAALNLAFFAVQAIIPKLASLLQLLAPGAALQQEEDALPFVLVDPGLFDEPVNDAPPDAESLVDREARQAGTAPPALPEDKPFVEEGVDELLSMPAGNPGPAESSAVNAPESPDAAPVPEQMEQSPGDQGEDGDAEQEPAEQSGPMEPIDPVEPMEATESPEQLDEPDSPPEPEQIPEPEPIEPMEIPEAVEPPPEPVEEPPPPAEPVYESFQPPPAPEPEPEPIPEPEPVPEPEPLPEPPEPLPEPPPEPEPVEQPIEEFIPPPPVESVPEPEMIDLAMLPVAPDGLYAPPPQPQSVPEWRDQPTESVNEYDEYEEFARRQYEALQERERQEQAQLQAQQQAAQQQQQPAQPARPRSREGRPQPTFRQIGRSGSRAGAPSRTGGAPRQRNLDTRVDLLDSDPNMKYLAHKYAEYMRKMARLLQESLNREVMLQPVGYTVGQAKIVFTVAPDGTLGPYRTLYPPGGDLDYVRITSEQTLVNAGPFDPPTPEMLRDPVFKQMSLTVNLY